MKFFFRPFLLAGLTCVILSSDAGAREEEVGKDKEVAPHPLRVLLVTGGASHDYRLRQKILVEGIAERVKHPLVWTVRLEGEGESDVHIPLFEDANWADGYDLVVHDYCFPRVKDRAYLDRILAPHRAGLPAVLVHGTILSFRSLAEEWGEFCGAKSSGHGKPLDFSVEVSPGGNPLVAGMPTWKIPQGELYEIERFLPGVTPLTFSLNATGEKVATSWTHLYGPAQTRIFATTLGNKITTLRNPAYLDLLAKGFLWALDSPGDETFIPVEVDQSLVLKIPDLRRAVLPRPGPNRCGRGFASALSSGAGTDFGADRAIDGDPDTYWEAESAGPSSWQVDLGTGREVGAVLLIWKEIGPGRCQVECSLDSFTWRTLFDGEASGPDPLTHGFDPHPARYLRLTIPETKPGEVPALREFAAYGSMAEVPAAFPDFRRINGSPRVDLAAVRFPGAGAEMKLAPGWEASPPSFLPEGRTVVRVIPTASGKALVLSVDETSGERSVFRASPDENGKLSFHELRGGLAAGTEVTWDGASLYTLDGADLSAFSETNGDGSFDVRSLIGKIFTPTVRRTDAVVTFKRLEAGPDGWFYAIATTPENLRGFDAGHNPVLLPRHSLVRFRRDGNDFQVVAALPLTVDDFLFGQDGAIFLHRPVVSHLVDGSGLALLPPLPNRRVPELPELPWPPAPDHDDPWQRLPVFVDRDRLRGEVTGKPAEVIGEINHLTSVADDGARLWVSAGEKGRGYLVVLSPSASQPPSVVNWRLLGSGTLFPYLGSPHRVVRTEAVFEILRRRVRPAKDLEKWLQAGPPPSAVAGILATLSASPDPRALEVLVAAATSSDPVTQALAFRHLGDHPEMKDHPVFAEIGKTTVPEVSAAILAAIARTGSSLPGLESLAFGLVSHPDAVLAATARGFLQTRAAVTVSFESLENKAASTTWPAAFSVLTGIHRLSVVERIVDLLEKTGSAEMRSRGLEALTALYYKDTADSEGWAGTAKVDSFLRTSLLDHRVDREKLLREMKVAGIPAPDRETLLILGKSALALEAYVIATLVSDNTSLPENARSWVEGLFRSPDRDPDLRGNALGLLVREPAAMEYRKGFEAVSGFVTLDSVTEGASHLIGQWLVRDDHTAEVPWLIEQTRKVDDQSRARLAWITLAELPQRQPLPPSSAFALQQRQEEVLHGPELEMTPLLRSLLWADEALVDQVLIRLSGPGRETIRAQVRAIIRQRSSREDLADGSGNLTTREIASLSETPDLLPSRLTVGRELFRTLACGACHNIHGEGPAFAPDLATAVRRLPRVELIKTILSPMRHVSPDYPATRFEMKGGRSRDGYEVSRKTGQIDLRDRVGNPFSLPLDRIEMESPLTGGVHGGADASALTKREFSALLAYLLSLAE